MQIKNNAEIKNILTYTKSDIFLWGCSFVTKQTIADLQKINIVISGVVDNNFLKNEYFNISVLVPEDLLGISNGILVIQGNHCIDIYRQLKSFDLPNMAIFFDFDNGADKLSQTSNLYFSFDGLFENTSIKELFFSSKQKLQLQSLNYIQKVLNGGGFLVGFDYIKKQYKKDVSLQNILENKLLEYTNKKINIKKLYIGCGDDYKDGYLHSDLRALNHVDIVCNAWELSLHIQGLEKLYTRHMLEHLTEKEAYLALKDWYGILSVGGEISIVVPNFDLRAKQWLDSKWEGIDNRTEDEIWSVAGCWGWQRECDPTEENYNQTYWDVHKSGYNKKRITMLLTKIGFVDIRTDIDKKNNLIALAYKK